MSRTLAIVLGLATVISACSSEPERTRPPIQTDDPDVSIGGNNNADMGTDAACIPETDEELCASEGYVCGPLQVEDSCGETRTISDCGTCADTEECGTDEQEGQCVCIAETDTEMCERLGYVCGTLQETDNCGESRTIESCGDAALICDDFESCGGAGTPGQCGCTPETDAEMCARLSFECGPLDDIDNCGVDRVIDSCGDEATVCVDFDTCGGGGTEGMCGCTPETCETLGVLCGEVADGCGGTLMCDNFCVDEVTAGDVHNCAIGSDKVKCWGNGSDGALGTGGTSTEKNPVDVVGLTDAAHIAAGGHHTCAVTNAQSVICWGKNDRSQLGIGNTVDSRQPGAAAIVSGAEQVVTGQEHTCARSGDKLECWGSNEFGQIGDANFNLNTNVGVPSLPTGLDTGVKDVTAGAFHTCVIQDEAPQAGLVKCWGRNRYAQSGRFTGGVRSTLWWAYENTFTWDGSTLINEPTTITKPDNTPFTGVKAVAAGDRHTCIIDADDQVWCWGTMPGLDKSACGPIEEKTNGQPCSIFPTSGVAVGDYRFVNDQDGNPVATFNSIKGMWVAEVPEQVAVPTDKVPVELAAGGDHHCMRVSNPDAGAGNLYCWGNSEFGQIGDGTNNHWAAPRLVIADTDGNLVSATQMALGGEHSCALVDDNNIRCWGSNAKSQIGNSALMRDESYRPYSVLLAFP